MNEIKQNDLKFGLKGEQDCIDIVRNYFDKELKKDNNNFFVFDYSCKNCYVELKSRRCNHNTYPDTMVGKNKLDYASNTDKEVYFVFSFFDGMYYWKYNTEDLANGNVSFRKGGRVDRGKDEIKDYAYIKTSCLSKIKN